MLTHNLPGNRGIIADLLISVEAQAHTQGWNTQAPTLMRISDAAGADFSVVETMQLGRLGEPGSELIRLATTVGSDPRAMAAIKRHWPVPPIAHVLLVETTCDTYEASDDAPPGTFRLGEPLPADAVSGPPVSSQDGRMAIAVVRNHLVMVTRTRGQEPELHVFTVADDIWRGAMWKALVSLHLATLRIYNDGSNN